MADEYVAIKSPRAEEQEELLWSQIPHPLENANWFSYITIGWMDQLIRRGAKKPLTEDDVWPLAHADTVDVLYENAMKHWKKDEKPVLYHVLWHAFRTRIILSFVWFSLYAILSLIQPIAVKSMIQFLEQTGGNIKTDLGISDGYVLAFILFIVSMLSVCLMDFAGYFAVHIAVNLKSVVSLMVYKKTLSLSGFSKSQFSSGEVVTMSSVDLERINLGFTLGHWTFLSPVMLTVIYIMLGFELGFLPALIGAVVMGLFIAFGFISGKKVGKLRQAILTVQARRVKLTNEVLQGIRVVKLYAWEESIQEQLQAIRLEELECLTRYHRLRITNNVVLMIAPVVSLAFSLMVYVARGGQLKLAVSFTALAYMNITRQPCGVFSTSVIGVTEALASCNRLTKYLHADEIDHLELESTPHDTSKTCVELVNADFSWTNDNSSPTLSQINLSIEPGTLTMIVGTVGCGKSSLLNAILGDIHHIGGTRSVHAQFSYVNQESWIQHATVRQNVTFGTEVDEEKYYRVVSACQLTPDFSMLPKGDETEIGERGINLSGGQKARISLARAMYHDEADIYLLDDPLSALDVHVANAVFTECMQGLLRGKTSVLVLTSHYHLLQNADRILVMSDGHIIGDGHYKDLIDEFPHLMTVAQTEVTEVAPEETSKAETEVVKKNDSLVVKEDIVKGDVTWASYNAYLGASGHNGYLAAFIIATLFIVSQVALSLTDWFMSVWARESPFSLSYGWGYVGIAAVSVVLVYGRSMFVLLTAMLCSKNFHSKVLHHVLHAPVPTFFDITPVGRILNRFSSDLDQIDSNLPHFGLYVLQFSFSIFAVLVVCASTTPWVIVLYLPMGYAFLKAQRMYNKAANEIKRLDGVTRSPLISLVSETYQGLTTIRAFGKSAAFSAKQREAVDFNMRFNFNMNIGARWFQMRLDFLGAFIVGGVAFVTVLTKSSLGIAAAGLSLTYSTQLSVLLSRLAVFAAWVDNLMTSVERLNHYNLLENEEMIEDSKPDTSWPSKGEIAFESFSMRYREHLDLVLNEVSFKVIPGHQVGICGRTGSGKSSLMSALFRIVPASSGRITIDGVDIATLSVTTLRAALTIIPQDPVLFSGSIRLNLDPTNTSNDADLWKAIKQVHMSDAIPNLEYEIAEKGSNLSVGQRQLVCIARALLRKSKIIVLDEATANIDPESDRLIQDTMRECFQNVTRLIIAHRLDTILDSDRILVLDAGVVKEYDTPAALLETKDGAFAQLAQHAHLDLDKLK